jgi:septum formation protein
VSVQFDRLRIILASRSPRRKELLRLLVPPESIEVLPPRDAEEAGFIGLYDLPSIEARLIEVACTKAADVSDQLRPRTSSQAEQPDPIIVAADTVIVVQDAAGRSRVLGQPPDDETWPDVVRSWFREHYAGRTHLALTALCVLSEPSFRRVCIARTKVTFTSDVDLLLEWYLSTGEPRGKAGGYAIQGAGSVFVTRIEGSFSNVVGLPLEELRDILNELDALAVTSERRN